MSKDGWAGMFAVAAGLLILWLLYQLQQKTSKITELMKEIQENKYINEDVKKRLKELVQSNRDLDPDVANELLQISALIEIKQESKAIAGLAKIIENLLKRLYQDDPEFKDRITRLKKTTPSFSDYIDYAKDKNVISPEDYHLVSVLRLIRNEESHELNVVKDPSHIIASFFAGIAVIITLTKLIRQRFGVQQHPIIEGTAPTQ